MGKAGIIIPIKNKKEHEMVISERILKDILQRLANVYPTMLNEEGYKELLNDFDEMLLDGHLLYLWEKGLINTYMTFNAHKKLWEINSEATRINAHGLDRLAEFHHCI